MSKVLGFTSAAFATLNHTKYLVHIDRSSFMSNTVAVVQKHCSLASSRHAFLFDNSFQDPVRVVLWLSLPPWKPQGLCF